MGKEFLPFKKGPFYLSFDNKLSILPIVIIGAHRVWPPHKIFPKPGSFTNFIFLKLLFRKDFDKIW